MWRDEGLLIPFEEGQFWIDNSIIKGITAEGEICYLYKVSTKDDLSQTFSKHRDFKKHQDRQFETWKETVLRESKRIEEIENQSIKLLRDSEYAKDGRKVVVLNSTGKDSMVTQRIVQKSGLQFETYFNVTTLDVGESNRMANELKFSKILPDIPKHGGFYQWREKENIIPSRLNRCCCKYFKEDPTILHFQDDERILFLLGMRNSESNARSGYEDIWINNKWGKRDWVGLLPIRQWTDLDIWLYIFKEKIPYNDKYTYGYDRVGCGIACPNYTKTTWVLDKYWYPTMYQRWQNILRDDFIRNNKWLVMNCTIDEYLKGAWTGGVWRPNPTKDVIDEYAEHSGLTVEVAAKYFNRYCMNGCKNKRRMPLKIKDKHTLAMNMKYHGRNIEKFMCKKCLMKELHINQEQWDQAIENFTRQGCVLF